MLKKLGSSLLVFIILATFSVSVFAAPSDGSGNTTSPAISSGSQQNPTGSAIKGASSTKSAISNDTSSTSESAVTTKSAVISKKSDFEDIIADVMKEGTAIRDEYFIVNITNPDKEMQYIDYKSYVLTGNSKYDDVIISIAKYNEETRKYEPMFNTVGESSWEISVLRLYSQEILLTEGTNKIMMSFYRTSQEAVRKNIQFNCFTISYLKDLKEQFKEPKSKVVKKTTDIIDFTTLFNSGKKIVK